MDSFVQFLYWVRIDFSDCKKIIEWELLTAIKNHTFSSCLDNTLFTYLFLIHEWSYALFKIKDFKYNWYNNKNNVEIIQNNEKNHNKTTGKTFKPSASLANKFSSYFIITKNRYARYVTSNMEFTLYRYRFWHSLKYLAVIP